MLTFFLTTTVALQFSKGFAVKLSKIVKYTGIQNTQLSKCLASKTKHLENLEKYWKLLYLLILYSKREQ